MRRKVLFVLLMATGVVLSRAQVKTEATQGQTEEAQAKAEATQGQTKEAQAKTEATQGQMKEAQAKTEATQERVPEGQAETEAAEGQTEEAQSQTQNDAKVISGMSILGNQEAPKSLVLVPWKSSEIGDSMDVSTVLDDSRQPVDREVFMRELRYYEIRSGKKP